MSNSCFYVMESDKSVTRHPEMMRNVESMMLDGLRRVAAENGMDVSTERDLQWHPPQFLILLFGEDPDGNETLARLVATSVEEATHVRMICEAVFDLA